VAVIAPDGAGDIMSDDNTTKTASKETISAIASESTHIATDSDAMRQNMVIVAEAMQPIIKRAGIMFSGSETWEIAGGAHGKRTFRIGIRKNTDAQWIIGVESTDLYPQEWDGSRWIGYADPFDEGAYSTGNAHIYGFEKIGRRGIETAIRRLPDFLNEYCAELRRRHQKYSDLREKAEQIRAIMGAI